MKSSYNKEIKLRCATCGDTEFEFNDDKSWIKCKRCNREYLGGYDELVELNKPMIETQIEETKSEIGNDLKDDLTEMLRKTFKGNKNIKFK
jgi:ribosomal protein L37AE/L43A